MTTERFPGIVPLRGRRYNVVRIVYTLPRRMATAGLIVHADGR
jgi:hypothetical protein